jgi:hypothetical protein
MLQFAMHVLQGLTPHLDLDLVQVVMLGHGQMLWVHHQLLNARFVILVHSHLLLGPVTLQFVIHVLQGLTPHPNRVPV